MPSHTRLVQPCLIISPARIPLPRNSIPDEPKAHPVGQRRPIRVPALPRRRLPQLVGGQPRATSPKGMPVSEELTLGLKCRLCGKIYPKTQALNFCTEDFGPLEVVYDYDAIGRVLDKETIRSRQHNMWRYRELLPIDGPPTVGLHVGGTPLIKADRLAKALGVAELYIKNDAVNHPSLSFKDRVVGVALSKAVELGLPDRRVRLDRQPRRQRRGERGGGGAGGGMS